MYEPSARDEIRGEVILASACAILVGIAYAQLPQHIIVGPNWTLLALEACLLAPLAYSVFWHPLPHHIARYIRIALQILLALALVISIILLVTSLPKVPQASRLLQPAGILWVSNILIFAQWYWELDGNGPIARRRALNQAHDFQFPQQATPQPQENRADMWQPGFIDYLFLAFCSSTALSPADTLPLTQRAKLLMMFQAIVSLLLLVMVVARAINIIQVPGG